MTVIRTVLPSALTSFDPAVTGDAIATSGAFPMAFDSASAAGKSAALGSCATTMNGPFAPEPNAVVVRS